MQYLCRGALTALDDSPGPEFALHTSLEFYFSAIACKPHAAQQSGLGYIIPGPGVSYAR